MAYDQDEYPVLQARAEESLAVFRETNDLVGQAAALRMLAFREIQRGEPATALMLGEESLALARQARDSWHVGHAWRVIGMAARDQGDLPRAQYCLEEALSIFRVFGDWPAVVGIHGDLARGVQALEASTDAQRLDNLANGDLAEESTSEMILAVWFFGRAWLERGRGSFHQAEELFKKAAVHFQAASKPTRLTDCLINLAAIAGKAGRHERAVVLAGATFAVARASGGKLSAVDRNAIDAIVDAAGAQLGEETSRVGRAKGESLALDQAVAYALGDDDG
jgi:tetratricopeptide (TPR) repeat protein